MFRFSRYVNFSYQTQSVVIHNTLNNQVVKAAGSQLHELSVLRASNCFPYNPDSALLKELKEKEMIFSQLDQEEIFAANQKRAMFIEPFQLQVIVSDPKYAPMSAKTFSALRNFLKKYTYLFSISEVQLRFLCLGSELEKEEIFSTMQWLQRLGNRTQVQYHFELTLDAALLSLDVVEEFFRNKGRRLEIACHFKAEAQDSFLEQLKQLKERKDDFEILIDLRDISDHAEFVLIVERLQELLHEDDRFRILINQDEAFKCLRVPFYGAYMLEGAGASAFLTKLCAELFKGQMHCFSMTRHGYTITPDAELYKYCRCPWIKPLKVGELKNGKTFKLDARKAEQSYDQGSEYCVKCSIYPLCLGKRCGRIKEEKVCQWKLSEYFYLLELLYSDKDKS